MLLYGACVYKIYTLDFSENDLFISCQVHASDVQDVVKCFLDHNSGSCTVFTM